MGFRLGGAWLGPGLIAGGHLEISCLFFFDTCTCNFTFASPLV